MTTDIERLREALKPFADEANRWHYSVSELVNVAEGDPDITIGDLRRAAEAYAALGAIQHE